MYGVVQHNSVHFIPCDLIFLLCPLMYGLVCLDGVGYFIQDQGSHRSARFEFPKLSLTFRGIFPSLSLTTWHIGITWNPVRSEEKFCTCNLWARNQGQTLGHLSQIIFDDFPKGKKKFPDFPWWWEPCSRQYVNHVDRVIPISSDPWVYIINITKTCQCIFAFFYWRLVTVSLKGF